jgi:signal transduction histidine kinase
VVSLTEQAVRMIEPYAAERQVSLAVRIKRAASGDADVRPLLDGPAIEQALLNLVDNAIKHSPAGETVTVGVEFNEAKPQAPVEASNGKAAHVQLWVEDHGAGIPAEDHEKIFERFYRRGSELRRETQGIGIGLSIVKHIVENHGGRVLLRSAPGKGSRFTIDLPLNGHATKPGHEPE